MQGEQGPPAAQPPQQPAQPPPPQRAGRRQQVWTIVRGLVLIIALLLAYYLLPSGSRIGVDGFTVMFCIGVVVLSALILILANRLLAADPAAAKTVGLLTVVCVAILFFARADYLLALEPGQFAELHTKTDALYFNVTTLATVGFGDVHPAGQVARAAVTVQIVFNLVFIGLGITLVTGLLKHRARSRSSGAGAVPPSESSFPS